MDAVTGRTVVAIDPRYFRPTEVDLLLGDASKARQQLGWRPRMTLDQLVQEMVASDLELIRSGGLNAQASLDAEAHILREIVAA